MAVFGISTSEARTSLMNRSTNLSDTQLSFIKNEVFSSDKALSLRGIIGLTELVRLGNNHNSKIALSILFECLRWRKFPTIIGVLANLSSLIEEGINITEYLNDLQISLGHLAIETRIDLEDSEIPLEDRLYARLFAASLANALYGFLIKKGEFIPDSVLLWKDICHDLEEFAEIRNSWK